MFEHKSTDACKKPQAKLEGNNMLLQRKLISQTSGKTCTMHTTIEGKLFTL